MGFFGKIFGKKEEEEVRTSVELLPGLLKDKFEFEEKEAGNFAGKKIAEISHLHKKAGMLLEDIQKKELEEGRNARFNKAALTAKKQVEKQLKSILEKLDPGERGKDLYDAKAYAGEGYALMLNEISTFRKSISYTSAFLKEEMSELGKVLQEMINSFNEMNNYFKERPRLFEFEKVKEKAKEFTEDREKAQKLEEEEKNNEEEMGRKENEKKKIASEKEGLEKGEEMEKLRKLEEEKGELAKKKQELRLEMSSLVSSVDRPLQRFNSLAESGRWKLEKTQKGLLEQFLKNPLIALKQDPKGEAIKQILEEVKKAIGEGKVELKEKEKEKRMNALNELIAFDFFGKVFWKLNEIQKRQSEIDKKISESEARKRVEGKEEEEKAKQKEITSLKSRNAEIEKEKKDLSEAIEQKMSFLKKFAEEALGKKVTLSEQKE